MKHTFTAKYLVFIAALLLQGTAYASAQTNQCVQPITYSIGAVDPRFNISSTSLRDVLLNAEKVWEASSSTQLFRYVEKGGAVTVTLIYDSRQETATRIRDTNERLGIIKTLFDALTARYASLSQESNNEQDRLQIKVDAYRVDEQAFNARVTAINQRGGATESEFTETEAQKRALESRFAELKSEENGLNTRIATLSSLGGLFNQLAQALNVYVDRYNVTVSTAGEFEEGFYQRKGSAQIIGIYSFTDTIQLTRVLAHEFGHALGLNHVSDENAIMYKVNKETSLKQTSADTSELQRVCGPKR